MAFDSCRGGFDAEFSGQLPGVCSDKLVTRTGGNPQGSKLPENPPAS
jgi:hypothetical protein